MSPPPYSAEEIARMERDLARDIDLLESGWEPPAAELMTAPLLDAWEVFELSDDEDGKPMFRLIGRCANHPVERSGAISTGLIEAWDPVAGWARTLRGWWILGDPAPHVVSAALLDCAVDDMDPEEVAGDDRKHPWRTSRIGDGELLSEFPDDEDLEGPKP